MSTEGLKLIEGSRAGNWDLYIDQKGWIWYVAFKNGAKSGYWGDKKHYLRMYGKAV